MAAVLALVAIGLLALTPPFGGMPVGGTLAVADATGAAVAYTRVLTGVLLLLLARQRHARAELAAAAAAFALTGIVSAVGSLLALGEPDGMVLGILSAGRLESAERLEFSARAALPLGLAFAVTLPWELAPVRSSVARAFAANAGLVTVAALPLLAVDVLFAGPLALWTGPDPSDVAAALVGVAVLLAARRTAPALWEWALLAAVASVVGAWTRIATLDLSAGWYLSLGLQMTAAVVVLVGVTMDAGMQLSAAAVLRVRRRFEGRIRELALHDEVTGLPNHHQLRERIDETLAGGGEASLVVLALDGIEPVLETFGQDSVDALLRGAAARLGEQGPPGTLARVGDEELALMLARRPRDPLEVATAAIRALDEPIDVGGAPLVIGASAGFAATPRDADNGELLLRRALLAARTARLRGRNALEYAAGMEPYRPDQIRLLSELRGAIARGELELFYQPKARMRDRTVVGVEGLVRWRHPRRGLLAPAEFVPLAERTDVIDDLTRWVFTAAAIRGAAWRREGLPLSVAVNLPARTLADRELPLQVEEAIDASGIESALLRFEVTESGAMQDLDRGLRRLNALRALGVGLAIDDFGTGYSSLAYLARLPVDEVKIDGSFVRAMRTDAKAATIVRSAVELCHQLGFTATAEGAEDPGDWDALAAMGCDHVQGYVVGRPVPHDDLVPHLRAAGWVLPE